MKFNHPFHFDPSYGYDLASFLSVRAPSAPDDFALFWKKRYLDALSVDSSLSLQACGSYCGFEIFDISYPSTDDYLIGGWLLEPEHHAIKQCIIVGHGYGGRDQPDYHFNIRDTAFLFPCFRGLSRSRDPRLPDQPDFHVLHEIEDPENYVIGGCVDDLWIAVSVMQKRYPQTVGRVGYMGISFGGGVGGLALPWDARIQRGHLNVPTFGCHPLRLQLPTIGSGAAIAHYVEQSGQIPVTLQYYDAAIAATFAKRPIHIAAALFDPMVAPPGQFAIYNAWNGPKQLFVLDAGHFEYPRQAQQNDQLLRELQVFFGEASS
ncbi:MAG: acetylxylan esterase [Gammaproteobacteria bacterium]